MITAKDFHSILLICLWLLVMLSPICTPGALRSGALLKLIFIPCSFDSDLKPGSSEQVAAV